MAGASGFLGTRLRRPARRDGHEIVRLVRRAPAQRRRDPRGRPPPGHLDPAALDGVGRGDQPGRREHRRPALDRRRTAGCCATAGSTPTATLATAIAERPEGDRPRVLLNSSGINCYGDTGDRAVEEDAPAGEGFLPDLCRVWEAATRPAEEAGVRVVLLRSGVPLEARRGLPQAADAAVPARHRRPDRAAAGSGCPWISLDDWLRCGALPARPRRTSPARSTWSARSRSPTPSSPRRSARRCTVPTVLPIPRVRREDRGRRGRRAGGDEHPCAARVCSTSAGYEFRYPDVRAALGAALT